MQTADLKTKRIFADVPASTANHFLAAARLQGTTGQALVAGWVDRYLIGGMEDHAKVSGDTIESVMRGVSWRGGGRDHRGSDGYAGCRSSARGNARSRMATRGWYSWMSLPARSAPGSS